MTPFMVASQRRAATVSSHGSAFEFDRPTRGFNACGVAGIGRHGAGRPHQGAPSPDRRGGVAARGHRLLSARFRDPAATDASGHFNRDSAQGKRATARRLGASCCRTVSICSGPGGSGRSGRAAGWREQGIHCGVGRARARRGPPSGGRDSGAPSDACPRPRRASACRAGGRRAGCRRAAFRGAGRSFR